MIWSWGKKTEGISEYCSSDKTNKNIEIPEEEKEDLEKINRYDAKRKKINEMTKNLPKMKKMIGYKAVSNSYKAFFGNYPKYEIGGDYEIFGKLVPCKYGFHFCKTLEDVMKLFPPIWGRHYLKVECEVPVQYYYSNSDNDIHNFIVTCADLAYDNAVSHFKQFGWWQFNEDCIYHSSFPDRNYFDSLKKKYIANKMHVIEEVPFEKYADKALNEVITTEEEYFFAGGFEKYKLILLKRIEEYSQNIFSPSFLAYWLNRIYFKTDYDKNDSTSYLKCFNSFKEKFDAIKDENISQDVKVLFMCNLI